MKRLFSISCLLLVACLALGACTHAMTRELREAVQPDITFKDIINSPEDHAGEQFIWGGFIATGKIKDNGTFLEIVQSPVDYSGMVIDPDVSEGRFLAFFPGQRLDPAIYKQGRVMTLGGTLAGVISGKVSDKEYIYPVLEVAEAQLWKTERGFYSRHRYWYDNPFHWSRKGVYKPY